MSAPNDYARSPDEDSDFDEFRAERTDIRLLCLDCLHNRHRRCEIYDCECAECGDDG